MTAIEATAGAKLPTTRPVFHIGYRYPHHARSSGQDRLTDYIGERVPLSRAARLLGDTVLRLPGHLAARRSGNKTYSRRDFVMEVQAAWHMRRHRGCIYHVLYGEKSYRYLGGWSDPRRNALIATFHQPPEVFLEYVANPEPLRRLTAVLAVASNQVQFLEQFAGKGRVFLTPYGVDTEFFVPPASAERPAPPFRLLTIGHHLRDFDTLADVIENVLKARDDAEVTILCFKRFVEQIRLGPRVRWIRRVSDKEYLDYLQQSHLLLLPLKASTTVTAALESMACGLPVVTTRGGIEDYLGDESGVALPPGDARAMTGAVLDLLVDPARRARMSAAARARALQFSWPRVAERVRAVYDEIAALM